MGRSVQATADATKYRTIDLNPATRANDIKRGVPYLTQIDDLEIQYDRATELWSYKKDRRLVDGECYFHMNAQGAIYAFCPPTDIGSKFHHSTLPGGGPTAGVGNTRFSAGALEATDPCSSHYKPPREIFEQFLAEIAERGQAISSVLVRYDCGW